MKQISILGCGWLGFPLAEFLLDKGFKINGSTTKLDKTHTLKFAGISPFLISLNPNKIEGDIYGFLNNSEVLIINIPPKLRSENTDNFVDKIKILISYIKNSTVQKVIFVSSTSVYANDNQTVTEKTVPNPDTENGKQLFEAEKLLQSNTDFKTTIIRFGGLIGGNRNPVYSLSDKKNVQNPEAPINLIHQKDCIEIIFEIIENENWNEIFNAVSDLHPTRKKYYTEKAKDLYLPVPEFDESKPSIGKLVLSEKIVRKFHKL